MLKRSLLAILISLFFVGTAVAVPMTWTDTIDWSPDVKIGGFFNPGEVTYTHDITDDGFTPFQDLIYNYSLEIALYDDFDRWDSSEWALIDQPGFFGDGFYDFSYTSEDFGWSFAGLLTLNIFGELDVTISSWWGDFYLDYSVLTANGYDNAPVPEPSTFLLLGAGIAGLAIYRRKKNS